MLGIAAPALFYGDALNLFLLDFFVGSAMKSLERVPGTAVFLSSTLEGVPPALLHNVKHNKVLL